KHARAIELALEHIARGDIYQVNLARRFWARYDGSPLALALAMRRESPVPLGMYFDDGRRAVVGRSMERFLRWQRSERRLETRPIKGTVARSGRDLEEQSALLGDPKEHAEHAMIVDLMRNDLGRVAAVGSVRVEQRFAVEPFARLHHLVSTVACTTRPEVRASDILYATFPPGSVTGTPKLRAIETIAALEPVRRGIYTGALGFVDRAGGLSLCVAIRTAVVEAGVASYFAGGGIVEASDIAREIAETELKARVFVDALRALGAARAGGFEPP
ncbi:MAG TPA: anthranilate synthase component I family protein, partial [Polyangiales bacterium]|nr:anthranilate synthase component I family protein [Polyangiales bacterium]